MSCPRPTHIAYNWEVCEALTLTMNEQDGEFTTEICSYEYALVVDENHGADRAAAEARIAALLGGAWKECFDEAMVSRSEESIEAAAPARLLDEESDE